MRLWTWHQPDFSLTSGRVEHSRSKYFATVPGVPDAYRELSHRLGTDQIVWCYVRPDEYIVLPGNTRVEWVLDVPDSEIVGTIDSFVWNRILGIKTFPEGLHRRWLMEAPSEPAARENYIDRCIEEYYAKVPLEGDWWAQLFISDLSEEGACVLLRHPVSESWVIQDGRLAARTSSGGIRD